MAHYVFQRNNGYGDFDYIRSFETMEITDYPEMAAQVDDKYLAYIDIPYLNSLGFYAVGITSLALRILAHLPFIPMARGFRPRVAPRPPRPHMPGAPLPRVGRAPQMPGPGPAPRVPGPRSARAAAPRPAAVRPAAAPKPPMPPMPKPAAPGRSPAAGPARGPLSPFGGPLDPRDPGRRGGR